MQPYIYNGIPFYNKTIVVLSSGVGITSNIIPNQKAIVITDLLCWTSGALSEFTQTGAVILNFPASSNISFTSPIKVSDYTPVFINSVGPVTINYYLENY